MKNALSRLHRLVDAVEPMSCKELSDAEVQSFMGSCAADCALATDFLLHKSTRLKNKHHLSLLIHFYQCGFVFMLDRVGRYQKLTYRPFLQPIYELLVSSFVSCLQHVQMRYGAYFDVEEKAADVSLEQVQVRLAPKWEAVMVNFRRQGIELGLVEVMRGFFSHFSDQAQRDWRSFQDLAYVEELVEQLERWGESDYDDATEELMLELVALNFNTNAFVTYCMKGILGKAEEAVTPRDKIEKLCRSRHELHYLPVKTQLLYSTKRPAIRMLLDSWLKDEIGLLESRYNSTAGASSSKMVWDENKIDTVFTVAQLSVWLRGAFEAGIFPGENIERLCRKLALLFRTKYQEHISPGSMQTKAYAITEKTKEVVNGYIIKMFNQIKGY